MASFTIVRELGSYERDGGLRRLFLALYCASDGAEDTGRKYIALSEQTRADKESEWVGTRKGITVRKSEVNGLIAALQSADFDAKPDNKHLSHKEYAEQCLDW